MNRKLLVQSLLVILAASSVRAADPPWIARSRVGMVAADSPEASQVGADMLASGGNAFDAAIATSLALAVARPQSTGLGGGGFMVAYLAKEKRVVVLDFREVAPAAATAERYAKLAVEAGDGPSPTVYGGNAIGVPGQVAGLEEIRKRFATREWHDLAADAIKLAETGFEVDAHFVGACEDVLKDLKKWPQLREHCGPLYETLLGNGASAKAGENMKRPELVRALKMLAEDGPDVFYNGVIAEALVRAAQAAGGTLTSADLAAYRVREREPLRAFVEARTGRYELVTMPPPSSGGICVIETLNVLYAARKPEILLTVPDERLLLVEALKHAFADRARWYGDPEFVDVPTKRLSSTEYAAELAKSVDPKHTLAPEKYGTAPPPKDDGGTSHFCIADRDGNIVSMTETVNGYFGSLVIAEPYGIILNNQMDDFAANPGKANLYGLVQSNRNAVAPGKRPLSSMTPILIFKDGKPVLALGGSGGPRIITSVLQVLLHVIDYRESLEAAETALRIHHQWMPDEVGFDKDPPPELFRALRALGHKFSSSRKVGNVQAIQFLEDGTIVGASDPRKGGRPVGLAAPPH